MSISFMKRKHRILSESLDMVPSTRVTAVSLRLKRMPFPGGSVWFLVLSTVPGDSVDEVCDELSDNQLASIKKQLASIFE